MGLRICWTDGFLREKLRHFCLYRVAHHYYFIFLLQKMNTVKFFFKRENFKTNKTFLYKVSKAERKRRRERFYLPLAISFRQGCLWGEWELSRVLKSWTGEGSTSLPLVLGEWMAVASWCSALQPDQHFKVPHFIGLVLRAEQSEGCPKDVTVVIPWDEQVLKFLLNCHHAWFIYIYSKPVQERGNALF